MRKMIEQVSNAKFKEVNRSNGFILSIKPIFTKNSKKLLLPVDDAIHVYNVAGGEFLQELKGHKAQIVSIVPYGDDHMAEVYCSCDLEGNCIVWGLDPSDVLETFKLDLPNDHTVRTILASIDGKSAIVVQEEGKDTGKLAYIKTPWNDTTLHYLSRAVIVGQNNVAHCQQGNFIAAQKVNRLLIAEIEGGEKRLQHKLGKVELTSIAAHPRQAVVATGDRLGRVIVWYNVLSLSPTKKVLHWHHMPVSDLAFSSLGNELYSGGRECTVVKWQLTEDRRYFLPRMGMPISLLITDSSNTCIASLHADNSISLINGREFTRQGIIQNLSINREENHFACGLLLHPNTNSVILNARYGHLQFYDISKRQQIYQVDVTLRNYITEERNNEISNIDVIHVAMCSYGRWMATFESEFPQNEYSYDHRLRFWEFKQEEQRWHLNTNIEVAHNIHIAGLDMQPTFKPEDSPTCLSYSADGVFKLWNLSVETSKTDDRICWNCVSNGDYRNLPLQTAKFTSDGSMFGVAFESTLTLWNSENSEFRGSLSQPYLTDPIRQIVFGHGKGNMPFVVLRTDKWLCCWNLLNCSLIWRIFVDCCYLLPEPTSGVIVGFTPTKDVFLFEPSICRPLLWQTNCTSSAVTKAVFVPQSNCTKQYPWKSNLTLCYLDEVRGLKTLELSEEGDNAMEVDDGPSINKMAEDPSNKSQAGLVGKLVPSTKTKDTRTMEDVEFTKKATGAEAEKFISKLLSDLTVHHMDSFGPLASEFCDIIVPNKELRCFSAPQPFNTTDDVEEVTVQRNKKTERVSKFDFQSLVQELQWEN